MNNRFALPKRNLVMLAIGFVVIVFGFCLMIGGSNTGKFDPEVFNFKRIVVAPMIVLFGFLFEIFAIIFISKEDKTKAIVAMERSDDGIPTLGKSKEDRSAISEGSDDPKLLGKK